MDNTSEEDLNEYLMLLEENGWYVSSDYAEKKNISLYFQFNAENLLQISVYTGESGDWRYDKLPAEILPPEKGELIEDVLIYGDSDAWYFTFRYGGLSEEDVRKYMESYLNEGWTGNDIYIEKKINWNGKNYTAYIEPVYEGGSVIILCSLISVE